MRLRDKATLEDQEAYRTHYESLGESQVWELAEKLTEFWDIDGGDKFNDNLQATLRENPHLSSVTGEEVIEALFAISQLWENGDLVMENHNDTLTILEHKVLIVTLANKLLQMELTAAAEQGEEHG